MTVEVSDLTINVPGGTIFTRQWRPDDFDGLPIILLHDSLGTVTLWRDFPAELAKATHRPVIAYDRLGYGQSTQRADAVADSFIEDEAKTYLPAVADAYGLKRYILFGHSVGGGMVLTAASMHREGCVAVISESGQAFVEEHTLSGIRDAERGFEDVEQFSRLVKWHGNRARWVLDAWTKVWLSPEFRSWSLDGCLERVKCPVLIIHGEQDEFGSMASPRLIAQGVNGPTEMAIVPECGHVPHRQKQDYVLSRVKTFLETYGIP